MYLTIEEIDHLLIFIHDYSEGCKVCRKTKEKLEETKKLLVERAELPKDYVDKELWWSRLKEFHNTGEL